MNFTRSAAGLALALLSLPLAAQQLVNYGSRQSPVMLAAPPSPAGKVTPMAKVTSLTEGFNDITTLAPGGWSLQNLSVAVGATGWSQGPDTNGGGPFNSFDGATNAYISANFNNTGNVGTISNWLITPVLDFGNGATFTFYTRKVAPDNFADRMEVRMSDNGASTLVGPGATDVGDFSDLLISINPNLQLGVYPTVWTQFTINHATHPQLPHSGTGRLAFRYFVTSAGLSGANSDFIGIDAVAYNSGAAEYQIGGTVSGLVGGGLALSLNGGPPLAANNGAFTFPPYLLTGANYAVTVQNQPTAPSQTCNVTNDSGVTNGTVTNVNVTCVTDTFTVGGNVTGLLGSGLVLQNNLGDDLPIAADGSFTFATALTDGADYDVTVSAQAVLPAQTCAVTDGSGTLASADVADVAVACTTDPFTLAVASGSAQFALFDTEFTAPLVVELTDGNDAAVPDTAVTFTAPGGGPSAVLDDGVQPSAAALAVETDNAGQAIVMATANAVSGCYGVVASADNAQSVAFELNNVNPEPVVFGDGFETPIPALKGVTVCQP